ncbi:cytochrome c [Ensifer adhaerens]|uniref:c-type cytochrome n=1 Tax=Ensifer adhaerens TaxID=106592 RepID=UPI001CBC5A7B|nr:c-type cytochrome [Ensifer adhaerens]MBZ7924169.1 cytochrome c [Ensifer adhaerens]UAX96572.1 cytochrome c [Ensifer adhaerens]UAY04084.1 cytochrome c [Ensifer adhaerens]UAY12070.1 cytochrome c [Ensifer adhaerens]
MSSNRKSLRAALFATTIAALGGIAVAFWYAYEPAIDKISRPDRESFSPDAIRRGEQLATVGDCIVCHTSEGGQPFAGARPLPTPFGTLYSTNITPDEDSGIGTWSEPAFIRAMKQGVRRDGSHLYPALPYEHFTHVRDEDLKDVYAFLMTRQPVMQQAPDNDLLPGLGFRPLLAGWKMLFLDQANFEPIASQTDEWNRGKYLVDGLAHCGGCHTPRNIAGGEKSGSEFAGGMAEGWIAPALDSSNPSAATWSEESLFDYLKTGFDQMHGVAAGPMGPVSEGLSNLADSDVSAIATYISSIMKDDGTEAVKEPADPIDNAQRAANDFPEGAQIFQGACASCHESGSPMLHQGRPPLSHLTSVKTGDPTNAVAAVLQGVAALPGKGAFMPAFGRNMSDKDLAQVLGYVRARFTHQTEWKNLEEIVASSRSKE